MKKIESDKEIKYLVKINSKEKITSQPDISINFNKVETSKSKTNVIEICITPNRDIIDEEKKNMIDLIVKELSKKFKTKKKYT